MIVIKSKHSSENTLSIISIAKRLSIDIIAEGVETPEQAEFYAANDCDELQGLLFSPPVPFADLVKLLQEESI